MAIACFKTLSLFCLFVLPFTTLFAQEEALVVEGAITIDTAEHQDFGTIQFKDGGFLGSTVYGWKRMDNLWEQSEIYHAYYLLGNVGIGEQEPVHPLTIRSYDEIGLQLNGDNLFSTKINVNTNFNTGMPGYGYSLEGNMLACSRLGPDTTWQLKVGPQVRFNLGKDGKAGLGTLPTDAQMTIRSEDQIGLRVNGHGNFHSDIWLNAAEEDADPRYVYAREGTFQGATKFDDDGAWQLDIFDPGSFQTKTRIHVENDGNVGIGTTSPSSPLHVSGVDNNGTDSPLRIQSGSQTMLIDGNEIDADEPIGLFLNNNSDKNVIIAKGGGRVGVGTDNPTRTFEVNEPDSDETHVRLTSASRNNLEFKHTNSGVTDWTITTIGSAMHFFANISPPIFNSTFMSLDASNSSVGIVHSNTVPAFNLDVNGDAAKIGGGPWSAPSDRRLKKDINPYEDGLTSVMAIEPVTFRYNDQYGFSSEKEYVGIIAQDIQKIAPYTVEEKIYKTRNEDGSTPETGESFLTFDGNALTYMLINAVQEQQTMIDQMKKEIEALKRR